VTGGVEVAGVVAASVVMGGGVTGGVEVAGVVATGVVMGGGVTGGVSVAVVVATGVVVGESESLEHPINSRKKTARTVTCLQFKNENGFISMFIVAFLNPTVRRPKIRPF
jgi:hypothetical protein